MRSPSNVPQISKFSLSSFFSSLLTTACLGLVFSLPSNAATQISIRAFGAERSIAVADLRRLASASELSDTLSGLFALAQLDPNTFRNYLSMSIDVKEYGIDLTTVDKFLNSYIVNLLLLDLGKSLRPPSDSPAAATNAIKSAIIAAIADDNKISLIEFIEKYPTEMIVEVEGLVRIQNRVSQDYANLAVPFGMIMQRFQMRR
jgi:hypothetical protein